MIKVLVNGAFGRMGSEVVRMVTANPELELIGGVDINAGGKTLPDGKPVFTDIAAALDAVTPDVVVDFTRPDVVMDSLRIILNKGIRAVVGTTGFTPERLAETLEKISGTLRVEDQNGNDMQIERLTYDRALEMIRNS